MKCLKKFKKTTTVNSKNKAVKWEIRANQNGNAGTSKSLLGGGIHSRAPSADLKVGQKIVEQVIP